MKVYERIRALREDREPKISQTELAKTFKTTQMKISRMETGRAEPSIEDLQQLCIFYNVSADYILGLPDNLPYPKR